MNREEREELLTRYMVGRYRLGHEKVALYLACVLFESLINRKSGVDSGDRKDLYAKIDELPDHMLKDSLFDRRDVFLKYVIKKYGIPTAFEMSQDEGARLHQVRTRLHNFRWFRNQFMHDGEPQEDGDNKKDDLINYIWAELAPKSFEKAYAQRRKGARIVDGLFEHTADYMVRAIDEVEARERDRGAGCPANGPQILRSDFDNLFRLRRKLVSLKNHLAQWLPKNAGFLHTDIVTTIDTTSGYIWMPLVSKKIKESEQTGIYACSVSILGTPLDLRIYMDFGGRSLEERKRYFDYLDHSAEYEALRHDLEKQTDLEVFDIDWYSSIVCRRHFPGWVDSKKAAIAQARAKLAEINGDEKDPITWNRLLHGYIFSKGDLEADACLDFATIEPQLRLIIRLFENYHAYKSEAERKERKDARGKNTPQ